MAAKKDHLLLCLALGKELADKTEKLPKLDRASAEGEIMRKSYKKNGMNNPGRS